MFLSNWKIVGSKVNCNGVFKVSSPPLELILIFTHWKIIRKKAISKHLSIFITLISTLIMQLTD